MCVLQPVNGVINEPIARFLNYGKRPGMVCTNQYIYFRQKQPGLMGTYRVLGAGHRGKGVFQMILVQLYMTVCYPRAFCTGTAPVGPR